MKIIFFSTKPYDKIWFEPVSRDYGYEVDFLEARLTEQTVPLANGADMICAFVNDEVNAAVIEQLAKFKVRAILLRCAGFNNVDLKKAAECGIKVLRVPSYSPEAVAEFAMGMLLAVDRQIHRAYTRTRDFNMNIHGLMGRDLNNKVAGIIGTGKIGQAMIRICKGFNMRVVAYDPYPNSSLDVEYVDLDTLFRWSDVISLHCPLTEDTRYIINSESLGKMKKGVYIINTSRGELIRTKDLIDALLEKGRIGGVGMDVYEEEEGVFYEDRSNEVVEDAMLARLVTFPNVLITSHQGYFTYEALQAICIVTMENAHAVENNLELVNEVK